MFRKLAELIDNGYSITQAFRQVQIDGTITIGKGTSGGIGQLNVKSSTASYVSVSEDVNSSTAFMGADSSNSAIFASLNSHNLQLRTNNINAVIIDTSQNFTVVKGTLGYGVGAGGAVTQITSKGTAVTLNKPTGRIVMHNASLPANDQVGFLVNNTFVNVSSVVILSPVAGSFALTASYHVRIDESVSNGFVVVLENKTGGALAEAYAFNFAIIQASIT